MAKVDKVEKLLKTLNSSLTRTEFTDAFKKVIDYVKKVEIKLTELIRSETRLEKEKLDRLAQEFDQVINKAKKDSDTTLGGIKKRITEMISSVFAKNEVNKRLENKIKEVDRKLSEIKQPEDGKDADEEFIIDTVLGKIRVPEDGKDADEDKIVDSVVSKIKIPDNTDKIKELEQEIEDLKEELRQTKKLKGGGTSAMGVAQAFKWILKTETPSGAIDGVNTDYTVTKDIFAVLAFSLNGEVIPQIPNYTISGKTITFSTALPAAYSGRDFEIKYV